MKQLCTLLLFLIVANACFSQDASYNNLSIGNLNKNDGAYGYFGWGDAPDNTKDPRPNIQPGRAPFMINNHTGLTLSAHSFYGGIRFYNQGYPNAYDPATGSIMVMSITNGNVGVGTISPSAKLEVNGNTFLNNGNSGYGVQGATLAFDNSHGMVGANKIKLYDTPNWVGGLGIKINTLTLHSGGNYSFYTSTTETSDGDNQMTILSTGNVGIGTTNPDARLAVNGTIHTKEVKVDLSIPVPDYVFKPAYPLSPLKKVKAYIDKNHHLPEIPSAEQIEKEGLDLGEASARQLKKIEELTLYLIEKDKQLNQQNQKIEAQALRLKNLETTVKRLAENIH